MFDLLLVLVQHPGRVLGKDFLLKSVWPDSFVEEGNITFNIRQLRKALDDNAQSPVYIETIPRRGYRFLFPVEAFTTVTPDKDEESIAKAREAARSAPDKKSPPYVFLSIIAGVVIAGALLIAGWFWIGTSSSVPILNAALSLEKLSTDGGVYHIAISPDGKNVVYTHRVSGKQSIWLRQLETSTNVSIVPPSSDFYGGLTISPDGNSVYFVRGTQQEPRLTVYRMPIFGGVPQRVTDGTQGWISLSRDGRKISYVRCPYTDEDWCSLYIADALDGKNEKKLVTRERPFRIGDNEISPDGKTVAFATGQSRTSSNEFSFAAVDVETGQVRDLTPEKFFNIGYIEWLPNESGWLITALQLPDAGRIWHILPDGEAKKLTTDSESYSRLSLDANGSILVSTQVEPDFRLMLYQTKNPAAPVILGNANTVAFAPDGKLFFSSGRTGNFEIWSINPDGSDLKQLTNNPSADSVPFLSGDPNTVFFQSDRSGVIQIWRMNADGSNQTQITTEEGGLALRISLDGEWLYYRSSLKGTLRRVSLLTGEEQPVLKELGRGLVISPDLSQIAYSQRRGTETTLIVASLVNGETIKTWKITTAPNLAHLAWSADGKYLAYVLTDDAREIGALWFQPLDTDTPRYIADLSGEGIAELAAFSMSPDAQSFAIIKGSWKHDAVLFRGLK